MPRAEGGVMAPRVLPAAPRVLRAIGFDDGPFRRRRGAPVNVVGVVCAGTRFEGMVKTRVRCDGWDATEALCRALIGGKFLPQLHLVLLDGVAFGGLNVVDLPELSQRLARPCVTVMRRAPDLEAMRRAIDHLPSPARRVATLAKAGVVHRHGPLFYQVCGADPAATGAALGRLTDRGHVPEALRIAHLIGSAWASGESGRRA